MTGYSAVKKYVAEINSAIKLGARVVPPVGTVFKWGKQSTAMRVVKVLRMGKCIYSVLSRSTEHTSMATTDLYVEQWLVNVTVISSPEPIRYWREF